MATAFDDDLVKRVDDGNATVVHGNLTGNATGQAGFPPSANRSEQIQMLVEFINVTKLERRRDKVVMWQGMSMTT